MPTIALDHLSVRRTSNEIGPGAAVTSANGIVGTKPAALMLRA